MAKVNGVNGGDSTPKIPNASNFESQQCTTASGLPTALNSVFSEVRNSGNCEIEMDVDTPYDNPPIFTTTTTCNGGQIIEQEDFGDTSKDIIRVNTGKLENRSGNTFNEYSVDRNNDGVIECKNQDNEPCK